MTDAQKVREECAARLEALWGVTPNDDGAARARIHNAQETASNCAQCGRRLKPPEPVWRKRLYLGPSFGGFHVRVAPICERCKGDRTFQYWSDEPCKGCGRPVYNEMNRVWRNHTVCCEVCGYKAASAVARQRRTKARGTRACQECGETFKHTRTDARFCSVACKQRAYRDRATAVVRNSRNGDAL